MPLTQSLWRQLVARKIGHGIQVARIQRNFSVSDRKLWSRLPMELILEIIKAICALSRRACLTMCLVSQAARDIASAILYRRITFKHPGQMKDFCSLHSIALKHAQFIHFSRRGWTSDHIFNAVGTDPIRSRAAVVQEEAVLSCTTPGHLRHITIPHDYWGCLLMFNHVSDICRPTSMTIYARPYLEHGSSLPQQHHATASALTMYFLPENTQKFTSVTHLEFEDSSYFVDAELPLHCFPNLTHIAWTLSGNGSSWGEAWLNADWQGNALPDQIRLAVLHIVPEFMGMSPELQRRWEALAVAQRSLFGSCG
jgi:hypothetical protein